MTPANRHPLPRFSPAEKSGAAALLGAAALYPFWPAASIAPLLVFLLVCAAAPFIPSSSFYLPVISRGARGSRAVALTFDDGPSPESTPRILHLLGRYGLPATFFVTGSKAQDHPELISAILRAGHTLGNHSWNHDYFLMLRRPARLGDDIGKTQEVLAAAGMRPRFFRPPVGVTGPRLRAVLAREDMVAINYSRRALDRGNRRVTRLAAKIIGRLRPGDIIMLHDLPVYRPQDIQLWQSELEGLFARLAEDCKVVPLEELIGIGSIDNRQREHS